MKKQIQKLFGALGLEVHRRTPESAPDPDGKIRQVCESARLERVTTVPRADFAMAQTPLFASPTRVPSDWPVRTQPSLRELAGHRSMGVYFQIDQRPDGPYLLDAHEGSVFWSCQRMIYAVILDAFGGTLKNRTVADIGCSPGYYCFHADRLGAREVIGVDARPEHQEQFALLHRMVGASSTCQYQSVDIEYGLEQLQGSHDLVLAQGVMYHVFDHPRFLKNLYRLTKHTLILEGSCSGRTDEFCRPRMENPKDPRESLHGPALYPSVSWMAEVARWAGFRRIRYVDFPSDLPPSMVHRGLWRAMLMCEK